jgi:putative membrane protein
MLDLWVKALHVFAVISWMAGMLYLPRLFVYHAGAAASSAQSETFKTMERRLLRGIMTPAMVVVWLTGPWLAYDMGFARAPWLHAKIALVLVMSALHGYFARMVRVFAADANRRSPRFYRIVNEVPTVVLLLIVVLVVVKPF